MTSDPIVTINAQEAYVWIWLPGKTSPVVAGRLYDAGVSPQRYFFAYGRSYLDRPNAIPLSPYEATGAERYEHHTRVFTR